VQSIECKQREAIGLAARRPPQHHRSIQLVHLAAGTAASSTTRTVQPQQPQPQPQVVWGGSGEWRERRTVDRGKRS
jgi:hypothetical protein